MKQFVQKRIIFFTVEIGKVLSQMCKPNKFKAS